MNNEPVAFMHKTISSWVSTFIYPETEPDEWLPLYTHPADESFDRTASHMAGEYVSYPAKTLTDEEIDELVHEYNCIDDFPHEFVRACIRKAQEK